MAEMKANNQATSAESLYESNGGACGPGYEVQVQKVYGAKCVCVDKSVCKEEPAPPPTEKQEVDFVITFENR
eukprot:240901-Prorocentrum_minimum.AAC.7